MIHNATSEELEKLLSNQNALTLYAKAKLKHQKRKVNCEVSEIVSFWKNGESWISEQQILQAAQFLEAMGLIRYVATEFSLIVEVKR